MTLLILVLAIIGGAGLISNSIDRTHEQQQPAAAAQVHEAPKPQRTHEDPGPLCDEGHEGVDQSQVTYVCKGGRWLLKVAE